MVDPGLKERISLEDLQAQAGLRTGRKHTLSILVENKPGVLTRIAGLFARRGFNIESLAVGPTELPDVSRMTIVVTVDLLPLEQVTKQLNKLINVLKIVELDPDASVQREIMLVKVKSDIDTRSHILETAQLFRAKVVDTSTEHFVFELTGKPSKLEQFIQIMTELGLTEVSRTGIAAIGRGPASL